jgi:uncharacterized protein (TIGR02271 family)
MESSDNGNIPWDEVIKKEARGTDDYDLGEVQLVASEDVITQKGIVSTKWYQIPKRLAVEFDGNKLVLKITEEEAELLYARADSPPELDEEESEAVSLVEERVEPQKKEVIEEATIVKEPVRETKQTDVSLTHEELVLERKPVTEPRPTDEKPVETRTEIKIPLEREEIESTKQAYVTEEVIAEKKPVTKTRNVTEEVTSEKITED